MPEKFDGFPIDTFRFLDTLSKNNNRKWFEKHKSDYENFVRLPALQKIEAMTEPLKAISPHFLAVAKKSGGSLMRVYRDTRFSKDKTPYKTNIGIQFRHQKGKDVHAPGFYFHVEPDEIFIGAGIWHPDSPTLAAIRKRIMSKSKEWTKITTEKKMTRTFRQAGESLVRPPRGFTPDHAMIEELKRKDHILVANLKHEDVARKSLCRKLAREFGKCAPYMKFLCDALKLRF